MTAAVLAGAARGFIANGVTFDASTYLTRGAGFTGAADGKQFTFSAWVQTDGTEILYLLNAETGGFFGIRCVLRNVAITTLNTSAAQNLVAVTTGNPLNTSGWNHIAISVDMASTSRRWIYINGVAATVTWSVYGNSNTDMTRTNWQVNASDSSGGGAQAFNLAEEWFTPTYIDLSVPSNLAKFISVSGKPVNLGVNGDLPTGSTPLLYLSRQNSGDVNTFVTNRGSGGGMTINGTLTASTTNPSD
jgi:hypothetical protein